MKLATTTADLDAFTHSHCDSIRYIRQAGFRYADFAFEKDYRLQENLFTDGWEKEIDKIKACAEEEGITFIQAHVLSQQDLYSKRIDREVVKKDIIRCIEGCKLLGIPQMVIHCQRSDEFGFEYDKWVEVNRQVLMEFAPWFEDAGVDILLENGPRKHAMAYQPDGKPYDPPKYYCSSVSGKILRDVVEYMNHPMIHACWDTGHANMNGSQYDDIMTLGDELKGLHIHDNHGNLDEHALPFFGSMNFDELMHALIDVGYQGYFTFEACCSLGREKVRPAARRQFPQDTRLFNPPLELKVSIEKFLYDAGKHILQAYNCFEE